MQIKVLKDNHIQNVIRMLNGFKSKPKETFWNQDVAQEK